MSVTGGNLTEAEAGFLETFPVVAASAAPPNSATVTGSATGPGTIELTVTADDGRGGVSSLVLWLIVRAKSEYGYDLPTSGAHLLIELTDFEFGRMDQELQKLALYADDQGKLDEQTIPQVVGGWRTRTMWEAIDAGVAGNASKAIELLDKLLRSGERPVRAGSYAARGMVQ